MSCLCLQQLRSLLNSLSTVPPLAGLVPALPPGLITAVNLAAVPPVRAGAAASIAGKADAALLANLATMQQLNTALRAAAGVNLMAPVPPATMAHLQARLTAQIQSLNASGGMLHAAVPSLSQWLHALSPLAQLIALLHALRTAFALDLRAPGAIAALQARLDARAAATAHASASASASAVAAAMASLGLAANAQGAAALQASMQATAALTQRLPAIGVNIGALSLLAALMALLAMILSALGVNLRAPNAVPQLRLVLAALPLAALANLRLDAAATARAQAVAQARASASAVASLNLRAAAHANLGAAARLAVLLQLVGHAGFLTVPPGSCGRPCPLALMPSRPA